ncbi:MAG: hypothetical protein JWQ73_552 [Variovorax sp.]|nr:hypothetical protein [Variovorax sp.]
MTLEKSATSESADQATGIEDLLQGYAARYPQQIRDLAETFSSATTRLGNAQGDPLAALAEDVRASARKHKVDAAMLLAAVSDYAVIESRSEAMQRARSNR